MDPSTSNSDLPRLVAPRPIFMNKQEKEEYEEIHRFVRERRRNNVVETKVHCRFYNMSNRDVDVIWCREEDEEDYIYSTLPPKRYFQLMTFQGHPWIFRSAEDGERMDIQKSEKRVHYPHTAPSKRAPANNGRDLLQAVLIKSPKVESTTLKQLCVRQLSRSFSTDFICSLKLPANIMSDILEYHINKIAYVNTLNPKQNSADKAPAVKTVDYLKQLMMKIESQEFKMDLREKLKKNLSLFASGMVPFGSISNDDEASTSGINKDNNDSDGKEVTRKRKASEGDSLGSTTKTLDNNVNNEEESVSTKKSLKDE